MLMYNSHMGYSQGDNFRRGFTIIEIMLFLAISGMLIAGVLIGIGDNIARQRYNEAVEDIADLLRNQYAYTTDVQIAERGVDDDVCYGLISEDIKTDGSSAEELNEFFASINETKSDAISGRGRTNCVVYGTVVTINNDTVQSTTMIGKDYRTLMRQVGLGLTTIEEIGFTNENLLNGEVNLNTMTDAEILHTFSHANNLYVRCHGTGASCYIRTPSAVRTTTTKWGTKLKNIYDEPLQATIIIFRSPRDGSIRTYTMPERVLKFEDEVIDYDAINAQNDNKGELYAPDILNRKGIYEYLTPTMMTQNDLYICVDSGDAQAYSSTQRMIKVNGHGHGQNAIELIDMDADSSGVSCQTKREGGE